MGIDHMMDYGLKSYEETIEKYNEELNEMAQYWAETMYFRKKMREGTLQISEDEYVKSFGTWRSRRQISNIGSFTARMERLWRVMLTRELERKNRWRTFLSSDLGRVLLT